MAQMKTPGVYIVEKDAFPNSVVQVPTAVPAFIGYTQRALNGHKSLLNQPMRITSMAEYMSYFGYGPDYNFTLNTVDPSAPGPNGEVIVPDFVQGDVNYSIDREGAKFRLFDSMRLFYQNGGGPCYVVSVGSYTDNEGKPVAIEGEKLTAGMQTLVKEQEPTMVVIPEAVSLDDVATANTLQGAMIDHCGTLTSRFAVLDIYDGDKDRNDPSGDVIDNFRNQVSSNYLKYGAVYYPWINTTIVQESELSFLSLTNLDVLQTILNTELGLTDVKPEDATPQQKTIIDAITSIPDVATKALAAVDPSSADVVAADDLNKSLVMLSPLFNAMLKTMRTKLNLLPPAAAMAGIYTQVDNTRGVWKAPANVVLSSTVSPSVNITFENQEDLNITLHGKSINAIRSFVGEGTLVWGARTLDGNSQDWRYVSVRRTMIMIEQSIKAAAKAYVFEPNDANTWITIKSMIDNFLNGMWKQGALVGAKPGDAFSVQVGLGQTMTANDILDGIMRITVLVAVSRPAEFIEITFQQQMQKS